METGRQYARRRPGGGSVMVYGDIQPVVLVILSTSDRIITAEKVSPPFIQYIIPGKHRILRAPCIN